MLTINAHAKINLTLDILGKRPDGYHEVAMIMQTIGLSDRLQVTETSKRSGIVLLGDVPGIFDVRRNLAYKAAQLMMDTFHIQQGIQIELTKRIPISAGLAGGSTDAAAVIIAMNELFRLKLKPEQLCAVGAQIGSDVAFCIRGGTMLATGRGECLEPLPAMPECHVILAKPQIRVSTAWAYQNYSADRVASHPDTEGMKACLMKRDLEGVSELLCNVLESVTAAKYVQITDLKSRMIRYGALASLMSGSGPTVFALTADEERASYIADKLREHTRAQVFLTRTVCGN